MKRTLALLALLMAACVDDNDDTQKLESASTAPVVFEANSALGVVPIDSASCATDLKRLEPGFEVYDSRDAFRSAYASARPRATYVPEIDFARYVVVASYLGAQSACQAQVAIAGATVGSESVKVDVNITPAEPCAASSSPFVFARLDRVELPYVASEHRELGGCP